MTTRIAILTGDTYAVRSRLRQHWSWDAQRRAWTMEVGDDETPDAILSRYVRALPGVRNRGDFRVTIEAPQ